MNYDFSPQEFDFCIKLHEAMSPYAEEKIEALRSAADLRYHLDQILSLLADTPYLKLGIMPVEGLNGLVTLMSALEAIAAISPSVALSIGHGTHIFGRIIDAWGDVAQKQKWLNPLLSGKLLGAVALCEESLNTDSDALITSGVRNGNWVTVNGHKPHVVNAPIADWIAVAGSLDHRPVLFIIEKENPGVSIRARKRTLGYEGTAMADIRLEGCIVPMDQVIAMGRSDGLSGIRLFENQLLTGLSLGLMKSAFEAAKSHAKTHKSGGKPIIAYQEIGFKLSEMLTLYQTAQLFALRAASSAQTRPREAESLALCAKVFCTEACETVSGEALRILGTAGYEVGKGAERAYRCAKYGQIAGTSTEIARVRIGDQALGLRV